ncbi:MAG: signal peptide peptidase SppA [Bacteroidetes bacterium]|nr:MAG: signal peptide peptidase SppA [Bacteroidota bacterium]PTM20451.1 MAG: signal peptide peptidase SppA [Bacteroidota bacterium]
MKSFFKNVFSVFVALILFSILSFFFMVTFLAILSPSDTVTVKENSVLHLDLNGKILTERSSPDEFAIPLPIPLLGNVGDAPSVGIDELKEAIRAAAKSEKIRGIFLEAGSMAGGGPLMQDLHKELLDFKESDKFILSYSENYSELGYMVSSAADSLYLHPYGLIDLSGLASQGIYLRGMFDKLEIEPEVFKVGEFKSAVETFMNYERSDEDRLQTLEFLRDLDNINLETIAEARGMEFDDLKEISNELLIRRAEDAVERGVADAIHYRNEVIRKLEAITGAEEDELETISASDLNKSPEKLSRPTSRDRVAVLYATGDIGSESSNGIQDAAMVEEIEKLRENDRVKAVVLRVDSPGGGVFASEEIRHNLELLQEEKPLIVSMSNVAASGGYWISMPADTIVAHENTITGSIGIFGIFFNVQGFMENKTGIRADIVKTGRYSDLPNPARSMTRGERAIFQELIEEGYDQFIDVVADGRQMEESRVREIAEGRVYSGRRALELGLVDLLGGLDLAVEIAAQKAGLEEYRVSEYPAQQSFVEQLFSDMGASARTRTLKNELGPLYPLYEQAQSVLKNQGVQARMPYDIIVD